MEKFFNRPKQHISNTKKEMWLLRQLEQHFVSSNLEVGHPARGILIELKTLRQEQVLRKARHAAMGRGVID